MSFSESDSVRRLRDYAKGTSALFEPQDAQLVVNEFLRLHAECEALRADATALRESREFLKNESDEVVDRVILRFRAMLRAS